VALDVAAELGSAASPELASECSRRFKQSSRRILTTSATKSSEVAESPFPDPENAPETRKLLACLGTFASCDRHPLQVSNLFSKFNKVFENTYSNQ
jgi:hypothetical protein